MTMKTYLLASEAPDITLRSWNVEPTVLLGLALVVGLYAGALYRNQQLRLPDPLEWWRPLCFLAGLAAIFVALASPLDLGADSYLLTLHMAQHALLGTLAPPLLVLGIPPFIARNLSTLPVLNRVLLLAHPIPAGMLFVANMWFWHIPPIYNVTTDYLVAHIAMHLSFVAAGLLFWWPLVQEWPREVRMSRGMKLVYLLATGHPMALLAALFFGTPTVLYDHYETTRNLWGISPIEDQQYAGLIMGALGESAGFIAFSYLFLKLMAEDDEPTVPAPA